MRQTRFLLFVLLVAIWTGTACAQMDVNTLLAKSDPMIQAQIERAANAFLGPGQSKPRTNVEGVQELKRLTELTDEDETIVEQLAIYAVTEAGAESQQDLKAGLVLYLLDLKPSMVIRVLAPYLDTDNQQLRFFAEMWFNSHDNAASAPPRSPPFQPVNFYDYEQYVSLKIGRGEEVPAGFIRYIYERSPGRALLVFAYASGSRDATTQFQAMRKILEARQQGKEPEPQPELGRHFEQRRQVRSSQKREIRLAEHIVSNAIWLNENKFDDRFRKTLPQAKDELEKLAKHNEWWARLYVAEIMREHAELRQPVIVEQLAADSNVLVSRAAKAVKE